MLYVSHSRGPGLFRGTASADVAELGPSSDSCGQGHRGIFQQAVVEVLSFVARRIALQTANLEGLIICSMLCCVQNVHGL